MQSAKLPLSSLVRKREGTEASSSLYFSTTNVMIVTSNRKQAFPLSDLFSGFILGQFSALFTLPK